MAETYITSIPYECVDQEVTQKSTQHVNDNVMEDTYDDDNIYDDVIISESPVYRHLPVEENLVLENCISYLRRYKYYIICLITLSIISYIVGYVFAAPECPSAAHEIPVANCNNVGCAHSHDDAY